MICCLSPYPSPLTNFKQTIKALSSLFDKFYSSERTVVDSKIIKDTNSVKNTVFASVLLKDSIYGLTFNINNFQRINEKQVLN